MSREETTTMCSRIRSIRVSVGKQVIYPIKFNGFELPGFDVEFEPADGVTVEEAIKDMYMRLRKVQKRAAALALQDWEESMGLAAKASVRSRG